MTPPRGVAAHARILAPIAAVGLIGAHLLVFGFVTWRFALTVAAVGALIAIALSLHLGLLASLTAWFRRRPR